MSLAKLRYPPDPARVRIATVDDLGRELELAPLGRERLVVIPWRGRMLRWTELLDTYRAEMATAGRNAEAATMLLRLCQRRGIDPQTGKVIRG